ncbi:hypothetical protein BCT47_23045 [Vibrio splendidus]|uniref:Uncharacterized protein n=1 Tax=Vibrio splendidus TaxID=29497 RepID=A0AB35N6T8_VIBSP|nr:hypothetical protein [Vibrio splendidus]MDP2504005.1 hypothetical protein [Vibrio splendidus]PMM74036.1 hypothetical protein BCT47_23045 [Vibrio splendidus]
MNIQSIIKVSVALLSIVLIGLSFWFGGDIPLKSQLPIYDGLRNTAAIIFAIMGAWIALLYPKVLGTSFGKKTDAQVEELKEIEKLFQPMLYSTLILMLVIIVSFVVPLAKLSPWLISHKEYLRSMSFGALSILTILQFWSLLLTLLPGDAVKDEVRDNLERAAVLKRMMPKKYKSPE